MKVTKKDIKALFDLVEGIEYPIHFLAGVNQQVGGTRYYYQNAPPNFLYFLKAVPFVPDFYRWGMTQKNLFPIHEEERTIKDVSVYTPKGKRNKIFKNLILNLQRDFEDRRLPVATPKMKLLPPQLPSPQRVPVSGNYNPIGTDIQFDSFLDPAIVSKLKYKPEMYNVQPEEAIGWVLFTDPNITQPINEAKVFYYNPFGYAYNSQNRYGCKYVGNIPHKEPQNPNIVDIAMVMFGICPKKNPMIKKILAFDIAKKLEDRGIKVVQSGNKLIIHFTPSMFTGNFFGKWAKEVVKAIRQTGKKFEKYITTPIRSRIKKNAPGIWKIIDNIDKKLGWSDIVKKYNTTVDVMVEKYGAKLMESAMMSMANYAGAEFGGQIGLSGDDVKNLTKTTIKVAEGLSGKDKSQLLDLVRSSVDITDLQSGDLKSITGKVLTNVKNQMIGQKGKEGEKDWDIFRDTLGDMLKDARGEAKKIFDTNIAKKIAPLARNTEQYKQLYSAFFKSTSKPKLTESEKEAIFKKKKEKFDREIKYDGRTYDEAIKEGIKWAEETSPIHFKSIPEQWRLPAIQKYFDEQYRQAGVIIPFENKKLFGKTYNEASSYAQEISRDSGLGNNVPFYWSELYVKDYFENYAKKVNQL